MDTEVLASVGQWPQQPLSDRFLKKNQVKIGLEFEVAYDVSDFIVSEEEPDYDDDFNDDDDDEATASSQALTEQIRAIDIQDEGGGIAEQGIDVYLFYCHLAREFLTLLPSEKIISMAPSYTYYRKLSNKYQGWNFTYDSSIEDGYPVELISPIMDASDNLNHKLAALWKFFRNTKASTNESTGLHVTMSCVAGTQHFNALVFALLAGDTDILRMCDRLENEHAQNSSVKLRDIIDNYDYESQEIQDQLNEMLSGSFSKYIQEELPESRYWSINTGKSGVIEYRGLGGNYLNTLSSERATAIIRRLASSFAIACNPAITLENASLYNWLRRKLYITYYEELAGTKPYKEKFEKPYIDKERGGSVSLNGTLGPENLPLVSFGATLAALGYGALQIKNSTFHMQFLYKKETNTWEMSNLIIGKTATQTRESTLNLARTIYSVLALMQNGIPSRLKKDLYGEASRRQIFDRVSSQLAAKLDLQGRSIGQIVKDAILVEANKHMWRLSKVDPDAYKHSQDLKVLADVATYIRECAGYIASTNNSEDTFIVSLAKYANKKQAQRTGQEFAAFRWQIEADANDYIDSVFALLLGVKWSSVAWVLQQKLTRSFDAIEALIKADKEMWAANQLYTWQREAIQLDTPQFKVKVGEIITQLNKSMVAIGVECFDVPNVKQVQEAWENVQGYARAWANDNPKFKLWLPGAVTPETVHQAIAEL